MSVLKTQPVFYCKRCGTSVVVSGLKTTVSDVNGKKLYAMLQGIAEVGLCRNCLKARDYYRAEGRPEDFWTG